MWNNCSGLAWSVGLFDCQTCRYHHTLHCSRKYHIEKYPHRMLFSDFVSEKHSPLDRDHISMWLGGFTTMCSPTSQSPMWRSHHAISESFHPQGDTLSPFPWTRQHWRFTSSRGQMQQETCCKVLRQSMCWQQQAMSALWMTSDSTCLTNFSPKSPAPYLPTVASSWTGNVACSRVTGSMWLLVPRRTWMRRGTRSPPASSATMRLWRVSERTLRRTLWAWLSLPQAEWLTAKFSFMTRYSCLTTRAFTCTRAPLQCCVFSNSPFTSFRFVVPGSLQALTVLHAVPFFWLDCCPMHYCFPVLSRLCCIHV